jgi:methionyl-tRNA formyltransferase
LDRAWTTFRGDRFRVLGARAHPPAGDPGVAGTPGTLVGTAVVTGAGTLELLEVQPAGRRPMGAPAWLAGARPRPGEQLGDEGPGR